jgi:hypothetical protein
LRRSSSCADVLCDEVAIVPPNSVNPAASLMKWCQFCEPPPGHNMFIRSTYVQMRRMICLSLPRNAGVGDSR